MQPRPNPRRRRVPLARGIHPRRSRPLTRRTTARRRRWRASQSSGVGAARSRCAGRPSAGPSGDASVRLTWQNQGKRHPTPRSQRTARTMITATQCRCARTLLRWSVSKLSSAASVSQSAIHDFELERRQPSTTTTDAIRRAFEGVGVVFLPKDDVQLRSDVSAAR
jgi:hypothetical protein